MLFSNQYAEFGDENYTDNRKNERKKIDVIHLNNFQRQTQQQQMHQPQQYQQTKDNFANYNNNFKLNKPFNLGDNHNQFLINLIDYWKEFRVENLENEINDYLNDLEDQISTHLDITEQFKNVDRILSQMEPQSNLVSIVDAFQNQINHLFNRITVSENFILKLAKFFNFLNEKNEKAYENNLNNLRTQVEKTNERSTPAKVRLTPNKTGKSPPTNFTASISPQISQQSQSFNLNNSFNTNPKNPTNNESYSEIRDETPEDNSETGKPETSEEGIEDDEIENGCAQNSLNVYQSAYVSPYDLTNEQIPEHITTTEQIARSIRECLVANKISQKSLAENLLNMKQANLSSLLSQPMSWQTLRKASRDRFVIMYLWLNDANKLDKLKNGPKTKLSLTPSVSTTKYSDNHLRDKNNNNNNKIGNSGLDKKHTRVPLTYEQKETLKEYFIHNPYPASYELELLSNELRLPVKKISTWFINFRQLNKDLVKKKKK